MTVASLPPTSLLLVTPTFHPEQVGTPHYATDFAKAVTASSTLGVVTNQPYYPTFKRFPGYGWNRRLDRLDSIPIYRLPTIVPRGGHLGLRILSETNMLLQVAGALLRRKLHRRQRVITISPGVPSAIIAGWLLTRFSGRHTVVVHDVGFGLARATGGRLGKVLSGLIRLVETWALNRADHITVLSDEMGEVLRVAGVTSPIATVELWPTIDPVHTPPSRSSNVLYSGNLGRKQGVHRLIDLADELQDLSPDTQVVIRGAGSERDALVHSIAEHGLKNVTFDPLVPAEELAQSLAAAEVHVVPQLPEGSTFAVPSKIINILAVGRPVVVTAHVDSPVGQLAVRCRAVVVVDPEDDQAFAHAVCRILSLPNPQYQELCEQARSWAAGVSREDAIRRTLAATWSEGEPWGER